MALLRASSPLSAMRNQGASAIERQRSTTVPQMQRGVAPPTRHLAQDLHTRDRHRKSPLFSALRSWRKNLTFLLRQNHRA